MKTARKSENIKALETMVSEFEQEHRFSKEQCYPHTSRSALLSVAKRTRQSRESLEQSSGNGYKEKLARLEKIEAFLNENLALCAPGRATDQMLVEAYCLAEKSVAERQFESTCDVATSKLQKASAQVSKATKPSTGESGKTYAPTEKTLSVSVRSLVRTQGKEVATYIAKPSVSAEEALQYYQRMVLLHQKHVETLAPAQNRRYRH